MSFVSTLFLPQDTQTQVAEIPVAIRLSHHRLGPIIFALHIPIGNAGWQKAKEGQDFRSPVDKRRKCLSSFFFFYDKLIHLPKGRRARKKTYLAGLTSC